MVTELFWNLFVGNTLSHFKPSERNDMADDKSDKPPNIEVPAAKNSSAKAEGNSRDADKPNNPTSLENDKKAS